MDMVREGVADRIMFSVEQAIGFACCNEQVPDKDGVTAAVVLAELVHWLAEAKHEDSSHPGTLTEWLQHLYTQYGLFVSNDGYIVEVRDR